MLHEGEYRKQEGMAILEENHPDFLEAMRKEARRIAALKGEVSTDDLRLYAAEKNLEPKSMYCWGAIFSSSDEWEFVRRETSKIRSNHARKVNVYRLRKTMKQLEV